MEIAFYARRQPAQDRGLSAWAAGGLPSEANAGLKHADQ